MCGAQVQLEGVGPLSVPLPTKVEGDFSCLCFHKSTDNHAWPLLRINLGEGDEKMDISEIFF